MPLPLADFYFARRSRQNLCLMACAAVAAVFLYRLHVTGIYFVISTCLFAAPAVLNYARAVKERHGDEKPDWLAKAGNSAQDRREFEHLPYENPFEAQPGQLALEDRITAAAEASMQFGRRISIVHIYAPGAGREVVEQAATVARAKLRPSDHVEVVHDDQIIVCVNMIRDMQNADLVLSRVRAAVSEQGIDCAGWSFGRALCPVHGYNGIDLIESARRDSGASPKAKRDDNGDSHNYSNDGGSLMSCNA